LSDVVEKKDFYKMAAKPVLYCAWFCPFAQRSWIALLEKGVDFEYKEQDPYDKTPEFLAINPRGLVPALIHGNDVVIESLIINEYVDEAWADKNPLYPPLSDPLERAKTRIALDFMGKKIVSPFITLHRSKDVSEKESAVETLGAAMDEFFGGASSQGPFYHGDTFGILDIALAPFVARMEIVEEFIDLKIFNDAKYSRFQMWWASVKERPSVKSTTSSRDKFLSRYQEKYFAGENPRTR